jgi:hypothetical protein
MPATHRDIRLRANAIRDLLDRHHRNHRGFAGDLGITPGYWSQLLNRHRRLTPTLRRKLLDHELVRQAGFSEADLWTIDEPS